MIFPWVLDNKFIVRLYLKITKTSLKNIENPDLRLLDSLPRLEEHTQKCAKTLFVKKIFFSHEFWLTETPAKFLKVSFCPKCTKNWF